MDIKSANRRAATLLAGAGLLLVVGARPAPRPPAVLRKDLKRDFGALGDGRTNDQAAFARAAAFFNQRAQGPDGAVPAVLFVPRGVYVVGRQAPGPNGYRWGDDVLPLVGCRNLTIAGQDSGRTEIRYAAGLRYGSFDPATGRAFQPPPGYFTDRAYAASGGTCVRLERCENVVVADLALNGNSPRLALGGAWGDTGIQLPFDGVFVTGSRGVTLRRVAVHHFGRDGVQVLNHLATGLADPARENIRFENSTFDYNGRQGLSLTGVHGFRADNCSFSHTARARNAGLGRALFSNPAAGVDVEPEGGTVAHLAFVGCRFVDNGGQGLVSDRPAGPHPPATADVRLVDCTLWGTTNWSAWVTQPGFSFENCRVYGAFVHGCAAATAAEATRFTGCTFADRPYAGRPALGPGLLLSDGHARGLRFDGCRFEAAHGALLRAVPLAAAAADSAAAFHFRGCTFEWRALGAPAAAGPALLLAGPVFSETTVLRNGPGTKGGAGAPVTFVLGDARAPLPAVLRAPGRLELRVRGAGTLVRGRFDVAWGPVLPTDSARVVVGAGHALALAAAAPGDTATLYLGPNARLVIERGGALELRRYAQVVVAGQLVVEPGAYYAHDPLATVRTEGRGEVLVSPAAVLVAPPAVR
ncbi:right-handed parallel beta-helix repeat-containing protein [Hymenobacter nivis]|nr:right-handed parallel beta-helix repeat-containing protein [Hymenobacter nivis]